MLYIYQQIIISNSTVSPTMFPESRTFRTEGRGSRLQAGRHETDIQPSNVWYPCDTCYQVAMREAGFLDRPKSDNLLKDSHIYCAWYPSTGGFGHSGLPCMILIDTATYRSLLRHPGYPNRLPGFNWCIINFYTYSSANLSCVQR